MFNLDKIEQIHYTLTVSPWMPLIIMLPRARIIHLKTPTSAPAPMGAFLFKIIYIIPSLCTEYLPLCGNLGS